MEGNYFTEDLVTDIIIRVWARDLLRYKSVSKSWHFLIRTNPYLLRIQRSALIDRPNLFIEEYFHPVVGSCSFYNYWIDLDSMEDQSINIREIDNPFDRDHDHPRRDARVLASCHDLLLRRQHDHHDNIAVYNLVTRKHFMVPPNPAGHNVYFFGFGYDRVHGCYKLLTRVKRSDQSLELMVYDLDKGTWRRLQFGMWWKSKFQDSNTNPFLYHMWDSWDATCVDGCLYWCLNINMPTNTRMVICFLLAEEEFHVVKPPDRFRSLIYFYPNMTVFDGRLCLMPQNCNYTSEFWSIDMDYNDDDGTRQWRWTKLLVLPSFNDNEYLTPLHFSTCKNKILILSDKDQLLWYDTLTKEFRKISNRINGRWLVSRRPFILVQRREEEGSS